MFGCVGYGVIEGIRICIGVLFYFTMIRFRFESG